jgi:UDP-N-acetylglucosamine--N-acetylmuramyl-(pentapeptide) pyrophosphoryl-undecaprenol N-acetylglucosamine transferase
MRIVVTGGGTAGHVTPTLAVASEIKAAHPRTKITYFRQFGDKMAKDKVSAAGAIGSSRVILAGKFRRFHGVAWWKQMLDLPMQLRNIRDGFLFLLGFVQSVFLLLIARPNVVFAKGGFVGLPVGLAAKLLRIPLVIHESDTIMGLTNRVLSKYATAVCVGAPVEHYNQKLASLEFVGVPVSREFIKRGERQRSELKSKLGFNSDSPLVLVTGGSNGAEKLNKAISDICLELSAITNVALITGYETYEETNNLIAERLSSSATPTPNELKVIDFVDGNMHEYISAADVVVSRVGATAMAELAVSCKATIVVPNPKLVQGHQLVNAKMYADANAALVINEEDLESNPSKLTQLIQTVLRDHETKSKLESNLAKFGKRDSAKIIAQKVIGIAE